MCIYCGTENYRKIYKNHNGDIPKDENGRSYEIHHIDGNHSNNNPDNLKAVTIKEHYDIHESQGDWAACLRMSKRMQLTPEKISELARKSNHKRITDGTHSFLKREDGSSVSKDNMMKPNYVNPLAKRSDGSSVTSDRYLSGFKSPFSKRDDGSSISKDRMSKPDYINPWAKRPDGTSVAQDQRKKPNYKNPWAKRPDGTSVASDLVTSGKHPSQMNWTCVCGKSGKGKGNFTRYHKGCAEN